MESARIVEIPIDELIGESWEGTLQRLTADMDPWDIDVAELARRYRDTIDTLRELQFVVPGRMVLTCSILLRMQSDDLLASARPAERNELIEELEEAVDEAAAEWEEPIEPEEFALPLLRRPGRQVTLDDLRQAFAAAMKVSHRRAERWASRVEDDEDPFSIYEIGGEDFAARLAALFAKIKKFLSGRRVLSFFRLLERGDKEERVQRFFEVLHLAAQGEICCTQEEFLGDILIALEKNA
jgi:segregation and condensation protein A